MHLRSLPFAKVAALLAACLACAAPAAADDAPAGGGFGYGTTPDQLVVRSAAMLNRTLNISGTLEAARAGDGVVVQRLLKDSTWSTVASATADEDGAFRTTWRTDHIGRHRLRAVLASAASAQATAAAAQATGNVTVYKRAVATWYGPSKTTSSQTACGVKLTKRTLGVAHKSLPCGTMVDFYYKGRTIQVPVIDRGPYREGASWDLTKAAADVLGFTDEGVVTLGAVRVRPAAS